MNPGNFFGAIFRTLGKLVMLLSLAWGVFVWFAAQDEPDPSLVVNILAFLLLAGTPFAMGFALARIGRRLQEPLPDELMRNGAPAAPEEVQVVRSPVPRRTPPRQLEEMDVDLAPADTAADPPAPPEQPAPQSDDVSMGVSEFVDPEKKRNDCTG